MSRQRFTGFPLLVRELVYDRSTGRCEICGQDAADGELHHRRPRGMGGSGRRDTNHASNAVLLCAACHRYTESCRTDAYNNGWLVKQSQSPLTTPVLYRGVWRLLDNEGHSYRIPEPAGGMAN